MKIVSLLSAGFASCALLGATLGAQGTVTGFVRDSGGRPLSGAEVGIEALGRRALTDEGGRYLLNNVAVGTHMLRARFLDARRERTFATRR